MWWSLGVRLDGVSQSRASGLLEDNDNCNTVQHLKPGFPLFACLSTAFFADRRPIRYQREGTSVFIRMEKISPNVVNHEGHRSTSTCSCPRVKKIWIQVSVSLWRLDRVQHLPSTGAFLPLCVEQKLEMCQEQCLIKLQLTLCCCSEEDGGKNHVGLLLYQHSDFSSSQSERSLSQGCFFCPPLLKGFKSPRAFSLVSPSHRYLAPTRECRHKADLFTLITKPRQSVLWLLFHPRTMLFNLKCLLGFAEKECFRRTKKKLRKTESA